MSRGAVSSAVRRAAGRVRARIARTRSEPLSGDHEPTPPKRRPAGLPAEAAQMLGHPGGRSVAIVAHPRCAGAVRAWLRRLQGDDVGLYYLGGAVSDRSPLASEAVAVEGIDELTESLARRGGLAVLVVVVPPALLPDDVSDHYEVLAHLLPQLRPQGTYVVDRSVELVAQPDGERRGVAPDQWQQLLAPARRRAAGSPHQQHTARMVRSIFVSPKVAVVTKRGVTPFKLREHETRTILAEREPDLRVDILATRPGGTLDVKVHERSYGPSRAESWPEQLVYPELYLRHYQGELLSRGGMLLQAGDTMLPESFRWPLDPGLGQPHAARLSDRFARLGPKPAAKRRLDGSYYYLDCVFSGHFGHLTTEVLCRLWGWEQAKREIPDLKVLFHTGRGKTGDLERRLFTAYGIAESDLVATDVPVRLRSVVGASPMWHNKEPHYVHPDIQDVWSRMTAGLLGDEQPSPHERIFVSRGPSLGHRRGCHNQEQVERFFADRGYHVFYPEELSLSEQVALFAGARVVAGFGGSALFNLMHARRLEAVVVLSSHAYVARNEHMFTSVLGGELHYFWGRSDVAPPAVGRKKASDRSPWTLDFDEVGGDLDRVLRSF